MRSRILLSLLALSFLFTLAACSSKPATDSAADQSATSTSSSSSPGGSSSGSMTREAAKPVAETVVIPAGTTLTVRLGESVGSKISSPGQSFTASLATPVDVGGKTIIPTGAAARGDPSAEDQRQVACSQLGM